MADMGSLLEARTGPAQAHPSVAAAPAGWRGGFLIAFVSLLALKITVAGTLSPFGDEAFYWEESRHLAWGYSDLPPLTAWLIRLGEMLAGHGLLGMRWPFLLLGSALPWLVVALARRLFGARAGWQAGLLCLALPLAGTLGVMALPDVPLTLAVLLALYALIRALDGQGGRFWLLLGAALAVAWLTHYRAAMAMLAGLLVMACTPRGRAQWRRPGLWAALAVASLGLLPLLVSNWRQHGAGLAFQLVERNPWQFHADALVQPLEQALACTPLLYGMLLWTAWQAWRRRRERPWDVLAWVALGFLLPYFVLGLFADDQRFRVHWPLPGYLPLVVALPALARRRGLRVLGGVAAAIGGLGTLLGLGYLAMAAQPAAARRLADYKAFPGNFVGWRESAAEARRLLRQRDAVLVADDFMMATELDFALPGSRTVFTLDSPRNVKHGRAPQLAIWRQDEAGLRARHAGAPVLLVVDESALSARERPAWLGSLCGRLDDLQPVARLDLYDGRKPIAFYRGRVPVGPRHAPGATPDCVVLRQTRSAPLAPAG